MNPTQLSLPLPLPSPTALPTFAHLRFFSSTSSPSTPGRLGSTKQLYLSSPHLAPILTHTCLAGICTFFVSLTPVHLNLFSLLMSLFPIPPFAFHSLTISRMNSIFFRNWFAAGMPWRSGLISGRRRREPVRVTGCLGCTEKLRRVCTG
jgi:hypothetical protein